MKSASSPTMDMTVENTTDAGRTHTDPVREQNLFEADGNWIRSRDTDSEPTISINERTSLSALISYVAIHCGENEFRVERRLSDRFRVANMTCLPAAHYDAAICYLVDGMNVVGNA